MSAEANIYTVLSPLAKVYPGVCTDATQPSQFIVYSRISTVPQNAIVGGAPGAAKVRMQVDAFARSYPAAKALADSIRGAMYAAAFRNWQDDEQDMYEADTKLFRVSMDWFVWQ
jgi:Protein of unknown function (DUF3168)